MKYSKKISYLKWYLKPGNKAKKAREKREKYQSDSEYREKVREAAKAYYWANREKRIAYNREYQKINKEERLARKKAKYHNDPEYREELLTDRKTRYYKKIEDESDEPKEPKKVTSNKPMPNADAIKEMQDIMFNMGKKWRQDG